MCCCCLCCLSILDAHNVGGTNTSGCSVNDNDRLASVSNTGLGKSIDDIGDDFISVIQTRQDNSIASLQDTAPLAGDLCVCG